MAITKKNWPNYGHPGTEEKGFDCLDLSSDREDEFKKELASLISQGWSVWMDWCDTAGNAPGAFLYRRVT